MESLVLPCPPFFLFSSLPLLIFPYSYPFLFFGNLQYNLVSLHLRALFILWREIFSSCKLVDNLKSAFHVLTVVILNSIFDDLIILMMPS